MLVRGSSRRAVTVYGNALCSFTFWKLRSYHTHGHSAAVAEGLTYHGRRLRCPGSFCPLVAAAVVVVSGRYIWGIAVVGNHFTSGVLF